MSDQAPFRGFPGISKGTAIPNLFFETVLPGIQSPAELLAFLWTARLVQEQPGEAPCISAADLWHWPAARQSFKSMGFDRQDMERALDACARRGVLLRVSVAGPQFRGDVFLVNDPRSRRAVARARSGQLELRPGAAPVHEYLPPRPDIFRLYEEHIGTVTPLVAERLAEAAGEYPHEWIEDAFREAAERNVRNWRYIERILESWSREGHPNEATPRDSFEDQKRRFLGGSWGPLAERR